MLRRMIGKLYSFTPSREVLSVIWELGLGQYYIQWVTWKEQNLKDFRLPYDFKRRMTRIGIILAVFTVGIVGSILNAPVTLRLAFGSIIVLYLLRYRYALLIVWVLLNVFIGSTLPIFNGNNFLLGLTVPTLLLLFVLPTQEALKRMPALVFLLAYLVWVLASIGITPIPPTTFLTEWVIAANSIAVGVLAISVLTTRRRMLGLIDAILLPSIFIALYGIYGYFTKQNGVLDVTTSLFRISSVFDIPPTLALFLSIIIPLSIYRTFTLQGIKRVSGMLVVLLLLVALGLTFTRAGLLSVPISILIMTLFLPSRKLRMSMLAGMIAVASLIALAATIGNTPIFGRFFNPDVSTLNGRTYLWDAVIDHFDPTQLLGNGQGASALLLINLQGGVFGVIGDATHNIFLETLYDHGIIGLTLLVLMFTSIVVKLFTKMRTATPDHRMLLGMAVAVFFNVFVQSFQSNDLWSSSIDIYFWIAMSLSFALCWTTSKQASTTDEDIAEKSYILRSETIQQQERQIAHM